MTESVAILPGGLKLAYEIHDFTDPWTNPETLILVHGFSKNRKFWYGWIPLLSRHYRVICVDQRGHGDSDPLPEGFRMALRPFADELAQFMGALGIASAHMVLAEFTTLVAIEFAIAYPHLIKTLALPGFNYDYTTATIDRGDWVKLIEEKGALAWARETNGNRLPADADPGFREWYITQQARMPDWVLIGLFRFNRTLNLTDRLPLIKVPVLVIAGGAAAQINQETLHRGVALIPDCTLTILEGMPYNVMSASPEACVAALRDYLDAFAKRVAPEVVPG